ncbi:hypothetical protein CMEL01_09147 [Colletotrichum melonis]|uniref:Uncharacterized protein n=1 Tax=Colletotrichum melonis TaxID=1209925 RepID=A0AAI9TZ06_9PEZI|nr:hypothetical protein CMEL01_09147 [Colletotrichum melonis]
MPRVLRWSIHHQTFKVCNARPWMKALEHCCGVKWVPKRFTFYFAILPLLIFALFELVFLPTRCIVCNRHQAQLV